MNPFGPAFKPAGKNTPVAGRIHRVVLTAPPPVTMFSTCVVLRAKTITLVGSASTIRAARHSRAPAQPVRRDERRQPVVIRIRVIRSRRRSYASSRSLRATHAMSKSRSCSRPTQLIRRIQCIDRRANQARVIRLDRQNARGRLTGSTTRSAATPRHDTLSRPRPQKHTRPPGTSHHLRTD